MFSQITHLYIFMEFAPLSSWFPNNPNWNTANHPLFIAGPCSAETPEQLMETCQDIAKDDRVQVLRAGIWKPRTRPNQFEGVGKIGLEWLSDVKKATGKLITTEVAKPEHVEEALKHGVDILWIGARSVVNPFTMQEIADSLKGIDVPVIVKNPINPDVALWMGGIERIYQAGITKMAALHRGFSSYGNTKYRNEPMWQLAIEIKSKLPSLPLLCDPSHIGGKRELIYPLSQKAMDLNYEGLMIETHRSPDDAWSDASQQVTPKKLAEILDKLIIRTGSLETLEKAGLSDKLQELRNQIDKIDREVVENFVARLELVKQIGDYKRENNLPVFQLDRWQKVFESRPEWAETMDINPDFVSAIFKLIHDESIRIQTERKEDF